MLVPDSSRLKVLLIGRIIDLLEDIHKAPIILLQDGVLGAHIKRHLLQQCHLERSMSKAIDRFVSVVHGQSDTARLIVKHLDTFRLTPLRGEDELESTRTGNDEVFGTVLVPMGVTTNDDGLFPALDKTGDSRDDDGFTEDSAAEDVTDRCGGLELGRG